MSYVRFCSPGELVTASTDSTLRLWGVEGEARAAPGASPAAQRVYEGHSNEKNFVGLAGARLLPACQLLDARGGCLGCV